MPPLALTYLKYAWAPQLSVSPICAYGPASARSPQATMGELLLAAELPPPELHAAMPPTIRTAAAAAVRAANGIRLRDIIANLLLLSFRDRRGASSRRARPGNPRGRHRRRAARWRARRSAR